MLLTVLAHARLDVIKKVVNANICCRVVRTSLQLCA